MYEQGENESSSFIIIIPDSENGDVRECDDVPGFSSGHYSTSDKKTKTHLVETDAATTFSAVDDVVVDDDDDDFFDDFDVANDGGVDADDDAVDAGLVATHDHLVDSDWLIWFLVLVVVVALMFYLMLYFDDD